MQQQIKSESSRISIERGSFLISLAIGLFVFRQIVFLFVDFFYIFFTVYGFPFLFLAYEGYSWAKVLWGISSIIGGILGVVLAVLEMQKGFSSDLVLALTIAITNGLTAYILFLSKDATAFLELRKTQPKYPPKILLPPPLPQYHELSEKVRASFGEDLPTYEITSVLPIPNENDKIILMKFTKAFRNVFRCTSDGSIIWQAELPTNSDDVYTNIEWKENQLTAFSRSCVFVVLDVESGKILSPTNTT